MDEDDPEQQFPSITSELNNGTTLTSILRPPSIIAMAPAADDKETKPIIAPPPFANNYYGNQQKEETSGSHHHRQDTTEEEQQGPPPSIDIFRNPLLADYIISDSSMHSDDGYEETDNMIRGTRIHNCMPKDMKKDEDRLDASINSEEEWAAKTLGSRSKMKPQRRRSSNSDHPSKSDAGNPFAYPTPAFAVASKNLRNSTNSDDGSCSVGGASISSGNNGSPSKKMTKRYSIRDRQELEMESILQTLEDLQHNFVENDNSDERCIQTTNSEAAKKEFTIRQFPNGDLFSGNVNVENGDLVYGRMTYALDMEVYEGPFWKGKRHGEGAVCMKMDGAAKFLGRYHEGDMHSGTLIVARNQPSDFTYTGTFLNNDFHGIGSIITQSGSIYQGQFEHGQFHGLGKLRTMHDDDDDIGVDGKKGESVYTGDFLDGLFHGDGSMIYSDGCTYVGRWREGKRVEGIETLPNGDVYEGKFIDDCRQGRGTLKTKDGLVTKHGLWEGNVLKEGGELSMTYCDGHVYTGDHIDERPHGFGKMDYIDFGPGALSYTGEFINGFRHGEGRCFFHKTGEEYEGEFVCDELVDLKLFQHDGPLLEESAPLVDQINYPTAPKESDETSRRLRHSTGSDNLNSSQISLLSVETEDSTTQSGHDKSQGGSRRGSLNSNGQPRSPNELKISIKSLSLADVTSDVPKLYRYQNGDTFKGRLDNNKKRQGPGVYTESKSGSVYDGDWKDNMRHGVGVLTFASGLEYSGEFFKDSIHGQGTIQLIDASVYTGSFFNGLFHGNGTLEDNAKKVVYSGEFSNGVRDGEGEESYPNGTRYNGEYRNGKRQGFGTLYDSEGNALYQGNWYEDAWHGNGTLFHHKQAGSSWEGKYEGDFAKGKFCGNGIYTYTDETIIEGQWLDDIPRDGDWTINYPDGSKFYGFATFRHPEDSLHDDTASGVSESSRGSTRKTSEVLRVPLPHGFGTLTYQSGQRYVGSFVYGDFQDT